VTTRFDITPTLAQALNRMHLEYPLEQLARSKSTRFQHGFARMAMHLLPYFKDAVLEASDNGLVILAASELALAFPVEVLRQIYADDLLIDEPKVRLRYGIDVGEPVMGVRAAVPRASTEPVVHDLIGRGAEIEQVDWLAPSPVVTAKAPLRELLGYPAALSELCAAKPELEMWLSHYAPMTPGPGTAA
jgi:hypothetical protein